MKEKIRRLLSIGYNRPNQINRQNGPNGHVRNKMPTKAKIALANKSSHKVQQFVSVGD